MLTHKVLQFDPKKNSLSLSLSLSLSSMATSSHGLVLRLSILLGLLAIAANARPGRHFHPCRTLIFFSSSSSYPRDDQNPNFLIQNPSSVFSARRSITFFITEVREVDRKPAFLSSRPMLFVDRANVEEEEKRPFPFGLYSSVGASFRDRTKDILSVVGSLLFGVGCGALTAATLYLMWSLFAPDRFDYRDSDEEFDDDESDDDVSPKKMGYAAIPAKEAPPAAPPAKEVA
ncbi:hypothetical protein NMG60_11007679 [Bertholletia excelsa]